MHASLGSGALDAHPHTLAQARRPARMPRTRSRTQTNTETNEQEQMLWAGRIKSKMESAEVKLDQVCGMLRAVWYAAWYVAWYVAYNYLPATCICRHSYICLPHEYAATSIRCNIDALLIDIFKFRFKS